MAMLRMSERSGTDRGYRRSAGLPVGVVDLEEVRDFGQPAFLDELHVIRVGVVALVGLLAGKLHRDPEAEGVLRAPLGEELERLDARNRRKPLGRRQEVT